MSFHDGCKAEVRFIMKELGYQVVEGPTFLLDNKNGVPLGNDRYNITQERADYIWDAYKDYFSQFDAIITSDTAPIARIFLRDDWKKPLLIWVCNRFDYADFGSQKDQKEPFPDPGYYNLIRSIPSRKNVALIYNTEFERMYAKLFRNVDVPGVIIQPTGWGRDEILVGGRNPQKEDDRMVFIPHYENEKQIKELRELLDKKSIPYFYKAGAWGGPYAIRNFRGVVHLPYAPSTIALFENLKVGLVYFIPSFRFFKQLLNKRDYWFQPQYNKEMLSLTEWYRKENQEIFVYFDSFSDLAKKIQNLNLENKRYDIEQFSFSHKEKQISLWKEIFKKLMDETIYVN